MGGMYNLIWGSASGLSFNEKFLFLGTESLAVKPGCVWERWRVPLG